MRILILSIFIIVAGVLFFTVPSKEISDDEIISKVFDTSNTQSILYKEHNEKTKIYRWKPSKKFKKAFPKDIVDGYQGYDMYLINKFISNDGKRLNLLFAAVYFSCHNCPPIILGASIDLNSKKLVIPLLFINTAGSSGIPPKIERITYGNSIDGLVLSSSYIGQGFTYVNTYLLDFTPTKITIILHLSQPGQISKCVIKKVEKTQGEKEIVAASMDEMKKNILNSYINEITDENGTFISSKSNFCNLFLVDDKENKPKIDVYYTYFSKNTEDSIDDISINIRKYMFEKNKQKYIFEKDKSIYHK